TFFRSPSKILFSSSDAFFTRSRTRPSELRVSKMTTRMTRPPITEMWRLSRSPSWKRMENSFSPISLARPPVAAMFPAVSEASEVVSRSCVAPMDAISWPFLSTRKTIFAFASRARRSQTALICWNSSSYITICGCIRGRPRPVGSGAFDANRAIHPYQDCGVRRFQARQCDRRLHFATPGKRARERDLVGILQGAAHRNSLRNPRDAHAQRLDEPRQVERRRLSFDGRIGGHDHFLHLAVQPRDQFFEFELIGPDAVERGERAVQHVVPAAELARALHREQIGDRLDHADDPGVALRVGADRARILRGQIAADGA